MKVIHLISTPSPINYGVWSVVIKLFAPLKEQFGVESELWFLETDEKLHEEIKTVEWRFIPGRKNALRQLINGYDPAVTLVVSHGIWSLPTKGGGVLKQKRYRWIAVPHGMLEPWSMRHRWLKKRVFYWLIEKPRLKSADAIVAVGRPEYKNLKKQFSNVIHISNGIDPYEGAIEKPAAPLRFLFLGRLHQKKGVVPLVKAWMDSQLMGDERYELVIAGPDEGEGEKIRRMMDEERRRKNEEGRTMKEVRGVKSEIGGGKSEVGGRRSEEGNRKNEAGSMKSELGKELEIAHQNPESKSHISYLLLPPTSYLNLHFTGPIYGPKKTQLLLTSHFFLLPSHSEGFPTAVLEAMTHGCIPLITEGCNFPEAFENEVAIRITPDSVSIRVALEKAAAMLGNQRDFLRVNVKKFVDKNYNWEYIAAEQFRLYTDLLSK